MAGTRMASETIRQFILNEVAEHPGDIVAHTAQMFGISRQAAHRHIRHLVDHSLLSVEGATRNRKYLLRPTMEWSRDYTLDGTLEEDVVWREDIRGLLCGLPDNALRILQHGITEMLNNAIDHSSGTKVHVSVAVTAATCEVNIVDDGEGIFKKLKRELNLNDERHAVLELSKGKLTTAPRKHSGEGIFFTSRMFDRFAIMSGSVVFSHDFEAIEDYILEYPKPKEGTQVFMKLLNQTSRQIKDIFDQYQSPDDLKFTKTVVPVFLAQYGDEQLVSRSQAKRLMAHLDKFNVVVLDFKEVESIGQAFADEIFRVYRLDHPSMTISKMNANEAVLRTIQHVED